MNEYPTKAREKTTLGWIENNEIFKLGANSKRVFERIGYDRSTRKYECKDLTDISVIKYFDAEKVVFTDFEF